MSRKALLWILAVFVVVAVLWFLHDINVIDAIKRLHGR
jgi:hypothetical protein